MMTRKHSGMSLIELMATLAIAAILTAMAIPGYSTFIMNNRAVATFNTFTSALQYARSEAIRRNTNITVCASQDFLNCGPSNEWEKGWIICDSSACGVEVLKIGEDISENFTLRASTDFSNDRRITFSSDGTLANNDGRGSFVLCDSRGTSDAKAIILNAVGRTQRGFDDDNDDIVDDHNGANVGC
ncbi:MAG: GspH/FimT family pseudopilin [Gammaproteobacteria bacterium]